MSQTYEDKLLVQWEDVYKKGQLTLWILLSLKDGPKYVEQILQFMTEVTEGNFGCDEQSLYRSLRKLYEVEIVDFEAQKSEKGPDKKVYLLSPLGGRLLERFLERNFKMFSSKALKKLIFKNL
jgi:PadR family transcriptional regulator PadR